MRPASAAKPAGQGGVDSDASPLLALHKVGVFFRDDDNRPLAAVSGVSLTLEPGAITCLVGESGCGKSLTARACLGLQPRGATVEGSVRFAGRELVGLSEKAWQQLRGNALAMIFQEPMTALNPVLKVGLQAAEPLRVHKGLGARAARERVVELFAQVGIPSPAERYDRYPHELSGGMRQRVMIAMALACEPQILFADEPTTALDATIQGQILAILHEQCRSRGMSVLLITHDLGVVAQVADTVGVMYAGHLVEWGRAQQVLANPQHPYTKGLMACDPGAFVHGLDAAHAAPSGQKGLRLPAIAGTVPPLGLLPQGCPFHPRCPLATKRCQRELPKEVVHDGHRVLCWQADGS